MYKFMSLAVVFAIVTALVAIVILFAVFNNTAISPNATQQPSTILTDKKIVDASVPTVTVLLNNKSPLVISLEDVKQMSKYELNQYGIYLIFCQVYGWGDKSSEFVEKMTYEFLPQWILDRIK